MKTVKIHISAVVDGKDGGINLLAKPNEVSPKTGTIGFDKSGAERLAKRCIGFDNIDSLKNYVKMSNGSAVLTVEIHAHEPGDSFKNLKTGETGTHKGTKVVAEDG